jgi:SAM-dependent methyltransferase
LTEVLHHYDDHLGPIYEWMAGPFEAACIPSTQLFEKLALAPHHSHLAIDLGCGHGLQSLPLARRGYRVIAVDQCAELLQALVGRIGRHPIQTLQAEITDCWDDIESELDVVVCMGDTLTHLESSDEVSGLIRRAAATLVPGGTFVTTFRDYVSTPLEGDQRFIPVRSDENRILTCFIELHDQHVRVHDLVHERSGSEWKLNVSSYSKLRLEPAWICSVIRESGMEIVMEKVERGWVTIAARS